MRLLLQFACGVIVGLEEVQDGHVTQERGERVKMVRDWKVLSFVAYRVQMVYETVPESMLGFTVIEEATSGATDTVDPLSDMKGLLWALDGDEGGGVGA
eukprot:g39786.t1